jgi:hypothetical protein
MVEGCLIGLSGLAVKRQNSETSEGVDESPRVNFQDLLTFMFTNITIPGAVKRHREGFVELGTSGQGGIIGGPTASDTFNPGSPSVGCT